MTIIMYGYTLVVIILTDCPLKDLIRLIIQGKYIVGDEKIYALSTTQSFKKHSFKNNLIRTEGELTLHVRNRFQHGDCHCAAFNCANN